MFHKKITPPPALARAEPWNVRVYCLSRLNVKCMMNGLKLNNVCCKNHRLITIQIEHKMSSFQDLRVFVHKEHGGKGPKKLSACSHAL